MIATPAKLNALAADRAPKGGMVSPVNGVFYAGGQFMPAGSLAMLQAPARLEGSWAQIPWAEKIRRQELGRVDSELAGLLGCVASGPAIMRAWRRTEIERTALERHRMMSETRADAWIRLRVGS